MSRHPVQALQRLQTIAALKKDAELARLAAVAQSRNRLESALDAVRRVEAPLDPKGMAGASTDPAMVVARLAHARWSEAQMRRLNQQLALVRADYLALEPAAARAFGRAAVLDELVEKARIEAKANKT